MKLRRIKIHGYRGIVDEEFAFRDYSLLVGPNNAGKSTVIDAIRAFYEKDGFKFRKESDAPLASPADEESWIECEFDLTDQEFDSLKDEYKAPGKRLRVRKYFQTSEKTHDGKPASGWIFGYKRDGTLSKEPFYGAKNVQSGKFGDLVYIPAISKVDEHAKLSGPSSLRDLLADIMSDVVEAGRAYGEFSTSVSKFSAAIREERTRDDRSLAGLEEELNGLLKPWDTEFRLRFPPPSVNDIIKSMVSWELVDRSHGKPQSIDCYGSGFQRHFIYSLVQIGARYAGKKPAKKSKDFAPSLNLILFDEPEAFLHPPQQEILARSLIALASSENWQVVCATHSPYFVSRNAADIPAIIRLQRDAGVIKKYQIDPAAWERIANANLVINDIAEKYPHVKRLLHQDDLKPEMEVVKHFLWLNPDRSSLFFANHVLLVEGPTEVALINRLIGDGKIENADCGLYVLDCLGKYNIHRFMNLLKGLGIAHSVVYDDDNDSREHEDIGRLIEDSAHPMLTLRVERIRGDLEAMLGVPPAGAKHRKPQHVLYWYTSGRIDKEKLDAFCELVSRCLPGGVAQEHVKSKVA